ncbi:MAG: hypothetical protein RTV31_09185 [Candidatus Thorarchaeota archaeon]
MANDNDRNSQSINIQVEYILRADNLVARTFSLWKRKLPQYIIIVGLVGLALALIQTLVLSAMFGFAGIGLMEYIGTNPLDAIIRLPPNTTPISALATTFILSFIGLLVYSVFGGAAIKYALTDYANPGSGDIKESFSFTVDRVIPLVGVQSLISLITLGLLFVVDMMLLIEPIISLVVIVLGVYFIVRLSTMLAVVINEVDIPKVAVARSWKMTKGYFWHILIGQLLMGIIVFIFTLAIGLAIGISFVSLIPSSEILVVVSIFISSVFLSPLNYIFQAVLYKDLETRDSANN